MGGRAQPDALDPAPREPPAPPPALGSREAFLLRLSDTLLPLRDAADIEAAGAPFLRDAAHDPALVAEAAERIRKSTERAAEIAAVEDSERKFRTLFSAMDEGYMISEVEFDPDGAVGDILYLEVNPAATRMFGVDRTGKRAREVGDFEAYWFDIWGEVARTGQSRRLERHSRTTGLWYDFYVFKPEPDDPASTRVAAVFQDATERRRAEMTLRESEERLRESAEHQSTLLAELQHRVRNILAMIQSIVRRTGSSAQTVEAYAELMVGRLMALARTQTLLTRSANAGADIGAIVREEIEAQAQHDGQYEIEGEPVVVSSKAAEVLTLAVHELTTNALKYGALSEPDGRVRVSWRVFERAETPWLALEWSERRATPLTLPVPARRGFGAELVERRVPHELRGKASLEISAEGAQCRLEFPLLPGASILNTDAPVRGRQPPTPEPGSDAVLEGRRILVVEDDFLLASDAENALGAVGAEVLGPYSGLAEAFTALGRVTPDAAVIDINLGEETTLELARALQARGIPFVFVTGYDDAMIPTDFRAIERLQKPISPRQLVHAIARTLL